MGNVGLVHLTQNHKVLTACSTSGKLTWSKNTWSALANKWSEWAKVRGASLSRSNVFK